MTDKTVCFTGHRKIPPEKLKSISQRLKATLIQLIENGYQFFGAGGALGFDYEKRKVMRSEVLDMA